MIFIKSALYIVNTKAFVNDVKNRNRKTNSLTYPGIILNNFLSYAMVILMQTKGAAHTKNDNDIIRCNINAFLQLALCLNNLIFLHFFTFFLRNKYVIIF